jgi:hypothetical protein
MVLHPRVRTGTHRRVTRRWKAISLVTVGAMAVFVAGCGSTSIARRVSLLPDEAVGGSSWDWTGGCEFTPSARGSCQPSAPTLRFGQLDGDEWNLGGGPPATRALRMSVSKPGALTITGALPTAPPCTASSCVGRGTETWVRGYPGVVYGIVQCHADPLARQSRSLRLPVRIDAIPNDLIGTTTYAVRAPRATYDVAYDMWLNDTNTKSPCLTNGTVEVMVWTDYDNQALLPGSQPVATATVPFSVNGRARSGAGSWSIYVNNVYPGGRTAPWGGTLYFILKRPYTESRATVSVDLSSVFTAVSQLLEENYHWQHFGTRYWLDTIPFGMEYGPNGAITGSGPAYFSLKLSSFCLEIGTTVARARCAAR